MVAGEVFADELGVGDVGVEGADEVVAVVVGAVDFVVPIVAEGFGEAHEVHPVAGPLFAEVGGAEEAVDLTFVGAGGLIVLKEIDFERGGGEAGEDEAETAEEGGAVGLAFGGREKFVDGFGRDAADGLEGPVFAAEFVVITRGTGAGG